MLRQLKLLHLSIVLVGPVETVVVEELEVLLGCVVLFLGVVPLVLAEVVDPGDLVQTLVVGERSLIVDCMGLLLVIVYVECLLAHQPHSLRHSLWYHLSPSQTGF